MVQTLEDIKGGGGSVRVGTTGKISSLMSRELDSMKHAPRMAVSSRDKSSEATILAPAGVTSPKRLRPRSSANEASSSHRKNINDRNPEFVRKAKNYTRKSQNIPMLNSGNVSLDVTPTREKPDRKGPNIVEIVDLKCGHPDRTWASPIANQLKKLSFSKLSREH